MNKNSPLLLSLPFMAKVRNLYGHLKHLNYDTYLPTFNSNNNRLYIRNLFNNQNK